MDRAPMSAEELLTSLLRVRAAALANVDRLQPDLVALAAAERPSGATARTSSRA